MPDSPDYQKYLPNSNRFSLSDLGEHAVRLGAISKFDRRGEIIWQDDFRYGMALSELSYNGAGSSINLVSGYGHQSPYFLRLITGAVIGAQASISKLIDIPQISSIGIEIALRPFTAFQNLLVTLSMTTPSLTLTGRLKLTDSDDSVNILTTGSAYQDAGTFYMENGNAGKFSLVKMVIDTINQKYKRLFIGDVEYPISDIATVTAAPSAIRRTSLTIIHNNSVAASVTLDFAHIIITANEP